MQGIRSPRILRPYHRPSPQDLKAWQGEYERNVKGRPEGRPLLPQSLRDALPDGPASVVKSTAYE